MKSLLLLIGLFSCFNIEAQTINKPILCIQVEELYKNLEKVGEKVVWVSPSPVEKSNYVFMGNRETGAWSLIQVIENIGCLVAFGGAIKMKDQL